MKPERPGFSYQRPNAHVLCRCGGRLKTSGSIFNNSSTGGKATPKTNDNQTLSSVIDELVALKSKAGRSDPYIKNIKLVLGQFAKGREALGIAAITTNEVETFLNSRNIGYRATLRARLSTLFKFAVRRRYRHDNPCDQLESITVIKGHPRHSP